MEQLQAWDDGTEEQVTPEAWNSESSVAQTYPLKIADSAGVGVLLDKAVGGGTEPSQTKAIIDGEQGSDLLKQGADIVRAKNETYYKKLFDDATASGDIQGAVHALERLTQNKEAMRNAAMPKQDITEVVEQGVKEFANESRSLVLPADTTISDIVDATIAGVDGETKGFVANAKKWGEFVLKNIALETYYRTKLVDSAANAFLLQGNKAGYYASTNSMKEDVRATLSALDPNEQLSFINRFVTYARKNGVDDVAITSFLASTLDSSKLEDTLNTVGDIAGPIGDLFLVGGLIAKGTKAGRILTAVGKAGGGKKLGEVVGESMNKADGLLRADEEVGFAVSLSPENVLPNGVFGTSTGVQSKLYQDTKKLLVDLEDRLHAQTTYDTEINTMVKALRDEFDPATNPAIRAYDVHEAGEKGVRSTATWATRDGNAFASEEAAHNFAKSKGMTKYEVIPDSASSGFHVRSDVMDAYIAELKAIQTKLAEVVPPKSAIRVYHGSVSPDRIPYLDEAYIGSGEGKATEGYGFYFSDKTNHARAFTEIEGGKGSLYSTVVNEEKMFPWHGYVSEAPAGVQNNILKAIKELSPRDYDFFKKNGLDLSGRELYRDVLNGSLDPKKASEVLSKYGVEGHYFDNMGEGYNYDAVARGIEGQHTNYVVYPKNGVVPVKFVNEGAPMASGKHVFTDDEWHKELEQVLKREHLHNNLWEGKTGGVLKNVNAEVKVGGEIGKKMSTAIEAWHDMLGFKGQKLVVITRAEAKKLAGKFKDMDLASIAITKNNDAIYFPHNGIHYIVMNTSVNTNKGLLTLSHEVGHMFHSVFKDMYDKQITKAWTKWKKSTLPQGKWTTLSTAEEMTRAMSFRIPTEVETGLKQWADVDPAYKVWLAQRDEWFAEQFAKWLTLDATPTSKWEELLSSTVNKLKTFANDVAVRLGVPANKADKFVSRFLNDHLVKVDEGNKAILEEASKLQGLRDREGELLTLIKEAEAEASLPKHGWLVREHRADEIKYDAIGGFDPKDIESSFWVGIDPKHLVSEFLVEGRVVGLHSEAKVMKSLSEFLIDTVSPLNKTELQRVYGTLKKGDKFSEGGGMGKEFNALELSSMGLSVKEQEAYFRVRTARNIMHALKDDEYSRALRKQGFNQIGIDFGGGKTFVSVGKEIDKPTLNSFVYDVRSKEEKFVTPEYIEEVKKNGGRFVKLEESHQPENGKRIFKTFAVDADNATVGEVRNVLRKREGEFSRIYTDEYFITLTKNADVDGSIEKITDTIHTAGTKKEAEGFVKAMNGLLKADPATLKLVDVEKAVGHWVDPAEVLKNIKEGLYQGAEFAQHYNRITEEYVTNFTRGMEGSLFTGRRGQRLTSISEDKDNILSIQDSLQAEIANTARVLGRTDWRNAAMQRWFNEAVKVDALPNHVKALSPAQAFEWAGQADFHYVGNAKVGKFLERTHKYIQMQLGMKTKDEQMWETVTRQFTESVEGFGTVGEKLEPVGKLLRQTSPGRFIRTVNFHSMLGFMNPSQLFVQSMGAVAAITLHPIYGAASGKAAPLMRMALMSDNPEVWSKFARINNFAELGFGSEEDFVKTIQAIRKSGILDGINATSLYNIEDGAYNVFSTAKRKLGKASLWTFNRGEEMARIISFDVARKEWQAAHVGKDFLTDGAIRDILIRTDDLTQNMTKANEAFFQRGVFAIPAQFMQYQLKLYANILSAFGTKTSYRGFTRKEAVKIMAGHVALFGLANNGFGSILEETFGDTADKANLTPDQRFFMSQGLIAGLVDQVTQALTGEEAKTGLGARLATFDWYQQFAQALTDKKFLEVAAGPSYSMVRTAGKIGDVYRMWVANPDISYGEIVDGIRQISETQISTMRNATKAYIAHLHDNVLQSNKGDDIAQLSNAEVIWQALGVAPVEVVEMSKLYKSSKDHFDTLRELTNIIATQQQRAINAYLEGDKELAHKLSDSAMSLMPTNAGDRDFVLKNLQKEQKVNRGYNEAVAKYLMTDMDADKPFLSKSLGE